MPNPLTYNDLRRLRYTGKFKLPKRFKVINSGTTKPSINSERDVLGTENYDSLATETQIRLGIE